MNEETVKIGGHYQTPLTFTSKEVDFPSNRTLEEIRPVVKKKDAKR